MAYRIIESLNGMPPEMALTDSSHETMEAALARLKEIRDQHQDDPQYREVICFDFALTVIAYPVQSGQQARIWEVKTDDPSSFIKDSGD